MRKLILMLVICSCTVLLFAQSASACLCQGGSQKKVFARAKKKASAIFIGRAVEVTNGFSTGEFRGWRVKLRVSQYWKGQLSDEMVVYTGPNGCAAFFEVGNEYLVFAYVPQGEQHLYTDVCMKTGLVRNSTDDLKRLGKGKVPSNQTSTRSNHAKHNNSFNRTRNQQTSHQ